MEKNDSKQHIYAYKRGQKGNIKKMKKGIDR